MGEGGSKERGWRVPRQRFCSSARETETFAVRAGEGERERESAASRENDSRRTNEKGSTMTAKRAHPPRRFDLSVLESLKRRLSFGRDVRITNIYIYIFRLRLRTVCTRGAGGASIHPFEHEHTRRRTLRVVSRIVEPSSSEGNARNQHTKQAG